MGTFIGLKATYSICMTSSGTDVTATHMTVKGKAEKRWWLLDLM